MEKSTFEALISLLDDNDAEVLDNITQKIRSEGRPIVPELESAWELVQDPLVQDRIVDLIKQIKLDVVYKGFKKWLNSPNQDLLEGLLLFCQFEYPDFDEQAIRNQIESIRIDAWLEMSYLLTPLQKIQTLNHIVYTKYKFLGNTQDYTNPNNSLLNKVLELRKGNHILLCCVYMLIAQRLDMPIKGVNLPQHFILAYEDTNAENQNSVLFYINAFNQGTIFNKKEIDNFLKMIDIEPEKKYYEPCSNLEIIKRMFNNLIFSFQQLKQDDKIDELTILRHLVEQWEKDNT